jgi:predicted enzyme related to lactoylglutathione lyase
MPNKHGEFIWYELLTDNSDEALAFYGAIALVGTRKARLETK